MNYENPTVTVTDASGAAIAATIVQLDDDDLTFQITDFAADASYDLTISGVRVGRNGSYTSVSGSFTVPPEGAAVIKKVGYDRDDREIDIEFSALVQYENPPCRSSPPTARPSTPPSTSGMRTASRPAWNRR